MSAGINPIGTVDALQLLIQIEFIWIFDFIISTMYKGETILILQRVSLFSVYILVNSYCELLLFKYNVF